MIHTIQTILPYGILASHVLFVVLFVSVLLRKTAGKELVNWVGKRAILLGFLISLASLCGSLFYSELVGYVPCVLCWWQRVFLYPQTILFGVALWQKRKDVFSYSLPLVLLSTIVSLYHEYVYMGGHSILPCTALGGACSKIYVLEFGYITIPMMSLTAALFLLLLAWIHKIYENRHA